MSIRAMRAAGRQGNERVVDTLEQIIKKGESSPLIAAEAVKALSAISSPEAEAILDAYVAVGPDTYPHRGSAVVADVLKSGGER